jgi:hypothetical protein
MLPDELLDGRVGDPPVFAVMKRTNLAAARKAIYVASGKSEHLSNFRNRQQFRRAGGFVGRYGVRRDRSTHRHNKPCEHLAQKLR